jgi:hypothetical protein
MGTKAALAGIACIIVWSSAAAAEQVRFRGAFTLTSVKNCIARYVGETFNSAYRPAKIGDNPDITSLTQLNQYSGDVYELPGKDFPLKKWVRVKAWGIDNLHYRFDAHIKITRQVPAKIDEKTQHVLLDGVIRNMGNDPGNGGTCVASFRGAYFRRTEW